MSRPQRLGGRRTISTADDPTPATAPEQTDRDTTGTAGAGAGAGAGSGRQQPVGYDQLEDIHVRMRDDQVAALDQTRRRLVRDSRRTRGPDTPYERITSNTLARVAIDLLVSRADELQGHTEAELRRSLGL